MDQKILTLIHFHKIYTYPKNQVSGFFSFFYLRCQILQRNLKEWRKNGNNSESIKPINKIQNTSGGIYAIFIMSKFQCSSSNGTAAITRTNKHTNILANLGNISKFPLLRSSIWARFMSVLIIYHNKDKTCQG